MKNRILYTSILLCLLLAGSATAQNFSSRKVYVDPGHDGYDANSRPMATINYPQSNSLGFYESTASLKKGLALRTWLQGANAQVMMSRTTAISTTAKNVTARANEARTWAASPLWSLHSNAANGSANYLLFLYDGNSSGTPTYPAAKALATAAWPKMWGNTLTPWTAYSETNMNMKTDQQNGGNLGVLGGPVGVLSEGSFHDYGPERHRLMSQAYCQMEAWNVFRGLCAYYGAGTPSKGAVTGFVKDQAKTISASTVPQRQDSYNTTTVRDHDKYFPINGCKVELMSGSTVVATYTTDGFYNGVFGFFDINPGSYTLRCSATGYNCATASVTVTAGGLACPKVYMTQGSNACPGANDPVEITKYVVGEGANAPYTPLLSSPYSFAYGKTISVGIPTATGTTASGPWETRTDNFTWTSSNTAVATVSNIGQITGVGNGTTTIKGVVTNGGSPATSYTKNSWLQFNISVTGAPTTVAVTGVTVSPTTLSINKGGTSTLTATVNPSNATNKTVSWSSNNTGVATVSTSGVVTTVATGTATITVTTQDGNKTATCAVTVVDVPVVAVTGVSVSPTTLSINKGGTSTLTATVSPGDATNKNVNWTSNNTGVATVSTSGVVTAVAAGTATITVTTVDGGKTATCAVTVTIGSNDQLKLVIVARKAPGEIPEAAATDPPLTSLLPETPADKTGSGVLFINDAQTNVAVTRSRELTPPTSYEIYPAGMAEVSNYGGISTTATVGYLTIKVINSGREGLITIPVGDLVGINTPEADAIKVLPTETGIAVQFEGSAIVELYTINGVLIDKAQAFQSYSRHLAKGVYIIRVNDQTRKFVK